MVTISCALVLVHCVPVCLGPERSLGEAQGLEGEVLAWVGRAPQPPFRGVVEFEVIMEDPPDPSRLEHVGILESALPESGVLNPEALGRAEEFLLEWGQRGVRVAQAWRVAVADDQHVRVEVSVRQLRPADPLEDPPILVVARDGSVVWQWLSVGGAVVHNGSPGATSIQVNLLTQGLTDVRRLLNYHPFGGTEFQVNRVREVGDVIIADTVPALPHPESNWNSRLTFARDSANLLLTEQTTVRPDHERYVAATFADYRQVGGRWIAHEQTIRAGPLAELDAANRPESSISTYRILRVNDVPEPSDVGVFSLPEGALDDPWGTRQYRYEEISSPGAQALRPGR